MKDHAGAYFVFSSFCFGALAHSSTDTTGSDESEIDSDFSEVAAGVIAGTGVVALLVTLYMCCCYQRTQNRYSQNQESRERVTELLKYAEANNWHRVKELIKKHFRHRDVRELLDEKNNSLFHYAVAQGHDELIEELGLISEGNVNGVNRDGQTALHLVEKLNTAMLLVEGGARYDVYDTERKSVLHHAVDKSDSDQLVAYLLSLIGNDQRILNAVDRSGKNCLHYACESCMGERRLTLQLLIRAGVNPQLRDKSGNSPGDYHDLSGFMGVEDDSTRLSLRPS